MAEELEKTETVRLPPHSTEAEQGLLGSLLIDNRVYDMVNDVVQAEDFYRGDHRRIYEHISNLITSGRPADVLTVHDSMVSVGLGQEGTKSFLNSLAMNTPNSANARRYAEIVRDRSILRSLVSAGSAIVDAALDTKGLETKDILDMAEKTVFGISEQAQTANEGLKPVKNALIAVNDQVTKLFNSKSSNIVTGVPTGFTDLDHLTKGMHPGELIVVAGRPAMGKTTFAMNIAEHVALRAGMPVAIFSMEMPAGGGSFAVSHSVIKGLNKSLVHILMYLALIEHRKIDKSRLDRHRRTETADHRRIFTFDDKTLALEVKAEINSPLKQIVDREDEGDCLTDYGRPSRTRDSPIENADENKVKHQVHCRGDGDKQEGTLSITHSAKHR